jgi:endonuclease/exonuclease/phosphatase family metal-dependent hydrolase
MVRNEPTAKRRLGIFNSLMLIIDLGFLLALILSYLAVYISPEKNWILPFFGLIYPFLLLVNLFFMIYWIFRRRWIFLVPAVVIFAGWGHIGRNFQVGFSSDIPDVQSFKVITFNVKNLSNDNVDLVDTEIRDNIIRYLDKESADIVCLQEFAVVHPDPDAFIDSISAVLDLPYHASSFYVSRPRKLMDAIITFSKYPILRETPIYKDETHNYGIQTDMLIGTDTVRLMNVHLESIRLKHEDYNFISELDLKFNEDEDIQEGSSRIIKKLRTAFARRADQVDSLSSSVNQSPYPVVLCGDFNDTPNSYTYQVLSSNLEDAFMESGHGFGNSYFGNLPSFRIDFIMYDEKFTSWDCHRDLVKFSDHYPVTCLIGKRQQH